MGTKADAMPLAEILGEGFFHLPWHQRPYDWAANNVQSLLSDILRCINGQHKEHLLGAVMLIPEDGSNWGINDGQQRIVTYSMICARMCRECIAKNDSSGESEMVRLLFDAPSRTPVTLNQALKNNYKLRVSVTTRDQTNYETLISGREVRKNGKMGEAWRVIDAFFNKNITEKNREGFLNFIIEGLVAIRVVIDAESDANIVFETLNTRGKSLEQIQLIRSYFYGHFKDAERRKKLKKRLDDMELILRDDAQISEYARCLFQAHYGHLSSTKFYRDFRDYLDQKFPAIEKRGEVIYSLVEDLAKKHKMQIFQALLGQHTNEELLEQLVKDARQSQAKRQISDYLRDLRGYSVAHSAMFALLYRYDEAVEKEDRMTSAKFATKCGKLLSSFIQRAAHSQGSFRPYLYEHRLAALAQEVLADKCKTPQDFLRALEKCDREKNILSKTQYLENMKRISFGSGAAKAKYLLSRIVEHQDDETIKETRCGIEHILPKGKIHLPGWDGFGADEARDYVHRLGNLTLLKTHENKSGKEFNANFGNKKKVYKTSSYSITRDICDYPEWNPASVDERQEAIASLAEEIWNFNIGK